MNTEHTPGPWKFSFESVDPEWAAVTNKAGNIVANVNSESGPDAISVLAVRKMPRDANAKLIAAAPELLAALVFLRREARASGIIPQEPCMVQAQKAIEKATGEV